MKRVKIKFSAGIPSALPGFHERRYGGCGVHTISDPYSGPSVLVFEGTDRLFHAVRMDRSPTGSALGSFRIDEVIHTNRGLVTIVHGYHCSYPDFEACLYGSSGAHPDSEYPVLSITPSLTWRRNMVVRKMTAADAAEVEVAFTQNLKDEKRRLEEKARAEAKQSREIERKLKAAQPPRKTHIKIHGKGVSAQRLSQILNSEFIAVEPTNEQIPLSEKPISATKYPRLMDYAVEGTQLRLLGMLDPTQEPTPEERTAMARRLNEVGPKLPRYITRAALAAHVIPERTEDPPASTPRRALNVLGPDKTSAIKNGVPLKRLCAAVEIDPKDARRILRSKKIEKPGGRWEWTPEKAKEIEVILNLGKEEP